MKQLQFKKRANKSESGVGEAYVDPLMECIKLARHVSYLTEDVLNAMNDKDILGGKSPADASKGGNEPELDLHLWDWGIDLYWCEQAIENLKKSLAREKANWELERKLIAKRRQQENLINT